MKHKADIYWTILPDIEIPKSIYRDPDKISTLAPCPVVADYSNRSRLLLSPFHLEIKPQWIFDHKVNGYVFQGFDYKSNDIRPELVWGMNTVMDTGQAQWYDQTKAQFQYIMPYVFITEEDVSMAIMGLQKSETKSNLDDLQFIEAVLEIQKMPRALSSAWAFQGMKSEAVFLKNQPQMKLLFSKPVRLHKFTSTPLFEEWTKENSRLVGYQRGTRNLFDLIHKRQPKNLFKEIKKNIEYSEA
jgi:hypothetical protein